MKKWTAAITAALLSITTPILIFTHPMPSVSGKGVSMADAPVYLTAHRGVNFRAPENSLEAFRMAVEMGYYSAETDIRLTKDNVWVVSHNSSISKYYTGKVNVEESTYEELQKYVMRSGRGLLTAMLKNGGPLRIPTLDEYLDVFVGAETRPQIELKSDGTAGLDQMLEAIEAKGLSKQSIVISFDADQLRYLRGKAPDLELWFLCDEITQEVIDETASIGGNVWISCSWEKNTIETLKRAKDADIPVSMWTVDKIKDAKAIYDAGFRYMETDRLSP